MRRILTAVLLLSLVPGALEAQGGGRGGGRRMGGQQRVQLEHEVLQRFMDQTTREFGLTATERETVQNILVENNERRNQMVAEGLRLRRQLTEAVRDNATDDELSRIMDEMVALREREHRMWREEQEAIRRALPVRKQAQITLRLIRFQEAIRNMIMQRSPRDSS